MGAESPELRNSGYSLKELDNSNSMCDSIHVSQVEGVNLTPAVGPEAGLHQ